MDSVILQGGLGNVLFQISALLGYSLKYNREYCLPIKSINPHKSEPNIPVFPKLNYCTGNKVGVTKAYSEEQFHYVEIPKIEADNILLSGYFQSFKYLEGYRDEVLKAFGFDDIVTTPDVCAIHIRSGDYKQFQDHHPLVTREYIGLAIGNMWFKGYKKFMVFSDEIEEAKEIIDSLKWFKELEFVYSEGKSALEDLRLMASCSSCITANSTLSLWAAYINPNPDKLIISPKKWFGDSVKHDTSDLYLPQTKIL